MIIPLKPWLDSFNGRIATDSRSISPALRQVAGLGHTAQAQRMEGEWSGRSQFFSRIVKPMDFYHDPIMSREILEAMKPAPGKQFLDGTLGGGGHTELLLRKGAHVIGCDQDGAALDYAVHRLASYGDAFLPVRGNFSEMDELLARHGISQVDGILLDLGVSSRQLDHADRGFSFREEGPLDMRMDDRADLSAFEVVNEWSDEELVRIFRDYGEERQAKRIAREIVKVRNSAPLRTTTELADLVAHVVPRVSGKHPATRVFQAIRIAVNRELEVLETALAKSVNLLNPGGVLAILTFHSLEDRIVKQFLHHRSQELIDRPEWSQPMRNPEYVYHLPRRKSLVPDEGEINQNPRARSARLRVAVRL